VQLVSHASSNRTSPGLGPSNFRMIFGSRRLDSEIAFPAKTSSERLFSGSRCYQTLYLKTFSGRAIVQGRVRRSSIPSLKIEKKRKTEKSTLKIDQN
jgi:hypothetical protein